MKALRGRNLKDFLWCPRRFQRITYMAQMSPQNAVRQDFSDLGDVYPPFEIVAGLGLLHGHPSVARNFIEARRRYSSVKRRAAWRSPQKNTGTP